MDASGDVYGSASAASRFLGALFEIVQTTE